ncbi:MAG: amino acid adenylation domain-containing protein [Actinobacteria bacterium]|nr:amino acid adenylation domain-containing protein [Actinomycetota bacterium]
MSFLLHRLIDDAALERPEHPAVRCAGVERTYAELAGAANGLARTLLDAGVRPGDRVGIHLPKRVETLVAVYGVLKAGAAYVPLDPKAPAPRVAIVAQDCAISALVTTPARATALLAQMEGPPLRVVVLVDDGTEAAALPSTVTDFDSAARPASDPEVPAIDTDVAYILYTSGSTGVPKGVTLTHRNALTFVEWSAARIGIEPGDRLSNHAPLHFDLSVFDLFLAALGRATVVLVPEEIAFLGTELARFVRSERITIWYSVPTALTLLARTGREPGAFPDLRTVVFAGEVYPTKDLRTLRHVVPDAALWNLYGPTETNVCTYYRVEEIPDDDQTIPIGRACENTEVFAVTDAGALAGVGDVGELYVRGATVMRGYWGRPDKTSEVLAPSPLPAHAGERAYRTGDLVRLRPDGDYDFLGRRDHQIKSRGYRIELGEIEVALRAHPALADAVAIAVPHDGWGTAIVACVVPSRGAAIAASDVKRHVAERLPRYMVPSSVEVLDELPRTSTGKVDRRRLEEVVNGSAATSSALAGGESAKVRTRSSSASGGGPRGRS